MKAAEIKSYLEEKYAFLSGKLLILCIQLKRLASIFDLFFVFIGAVDRKGYLIITLPSSTSIEKLSGEELKKLIIYLTSIK